MLCIDKYQDKSDFDRFNFHTNTLEFCYSNNFSKDLLQEFAKKSCIFFPEKVSKIIKIDKINFNSFELLDEKPNLYANLPDPIACQWEWITTFYKYVRWTEENISYGFIGELLNEFKNTFKTKIFIDSLKNTNTKLFLGKNDKYVAMLFDELDLLMLCCDTFMILSSKSFDNFTIFLKNTLYTNCNGYVNVINFYENYSTAYFHNPDKSISQVNTINHNVYMSTYRNNRDICKYFTLRDINKQKTIVRKRNFICEELTDYENDIRIIKSYTNDKFYKTCPKTPQEIDKADINTATYQKIETLKKATTIMKLDGKTVYKKDNEEVIINKLDKKLKVENDILICYKLCKNAKNEDRIVKLGIPIDGKTVKAIDEEYFMNCEKERANSAIVLDIQLPDLNNEISVIPKETSCFSGIHNKKLEYKAGKMVYPDNFCEDNSISCAEGIHYHQNRRAVFKRWIAGYEDIDL